ncbi:hypothetical protein ACKUSY_04120 [Myroides odoratus]
MFKKTKNLILLILLVCCSFSYAQVGIGTERPTEEFEIVGTMRLRGLEQKSSNTHYREVRSDNEGHLTAIQNGSNSGLYFNNLIKQFMNQSIGVPQNMPQDLGVKLSVELAPNSETTVILSYNIPVFLKVSTAQPIPYFGGVEIKRKQNGSMVTLAGASRKFSLPSSFPTGSVDLRGLFVDGKYVDVIRNTTNGTQTIEYSLMGFIEAPAFTALFYSDEPSNTGTGNMGVGVFSAIVFNKTF